LRRENYSVRKFHIRDEHPEQILREEDWQVSPVFNKRGWEALVNDKWKQF